jgi:Sulfotransferase family
VSAKELHYFDQFHAGITAPEVEAYHSYFPRRPGELAGEWTPFYLSAPWIPQQLAAAAPEARLLVILRDPVERYLSGVQLGMKFADRRGIVLNRHVPMEAFVRGLYHAQLSQLLRYFDRSKVLILQYERCVAETAGELRRTFDFLGVEGPEFVPDLSRHPQHQPQKPPLDAGARRSFAEAYEADVERLAADFSEIDLTLWANFAHLAR